MSPSTLLLVLSMLAQAEPTDAAKKAQDELQGSWIAVGLEEKGQKATPEQVQKENISITIKGNELALRHGRGTPDRFSFSLDPSKKPAHMDLKDLGDKARPGVLHAIYAVEKGELRLCFGSNLTPNKPEERPQEFATIRGEKDRPPKGKVMFIFKKSEK